MNSFYRLSTLCLSATTLTLTLGMPIESTMAQDRSLHDRIFEQHRERRAGILNGIGEAFSNFFESDPSYREERRRYDESNNPDRIYESSRPAPRSVPPGWDAPFPPPSDLVTPRDRYDIYRREQQRGRETFREWTPEPTRSREEVPTNRPMTREPVADDPNRQYYDRPEFFENLPGDQTPVTKVEPRVRTSPLEDSRVTIPEGSRESRRIGSRVLLDDAAPSTEMEDRIATPPLPVEPGETIGSSTPAARAPEFKPAPNDTPMIVGGQSAIPEGAQTVPLDSEFSTSSGGTVTLGGLLEGNQAVMIDFWATWSGESMTSLGNMNLLAAEMQALGIAVVGMNFDGNSDTVERVRRGQDITIPWLLEPRSRPFSRDMAISSVPHRILIDSRGVVRFSGAPDDDSLRQAIDGVVNGGLGQVGQ